MREFGLKGFGLARVYCTGYWCSIILRQPCKQAVAVSLYLINSNKDVQKILPHFIFIFLYSVQLKIFVDGLFHLNTDLSQFKEHLRDFLIQIKVGADI